MQRLNMQRKTQSKVQNYLRHFLRTSLHTFSLVIKGAEEREGKDSETFHRPLDIRDHSRKLVSPSRFRIFILAYAPPTTNTVLCTVSGVGITVVHT